MLHLYSEQSQFYIPHQSFSLFGPQFLRTVSDQTANVALSSNVRYSHYQLIIFNNFVYIFILFLALETVAKAEVKMTVQSMRKHGEDKVIIVLLIFIFSTGYR